MLVSAQVHRFCQFKTEYYHWLISDNYKVGIFFVKIVLLFLLLTNDNFTSITNQ